MTYTEVEIFVGVVVVATLLCLVVRQIFWSIERYEFRKVEADIRYHERYLEALSEKLNAVSDYLGIKVVKKSGWETEEIDREEDE